MQKVTEKRLENLFNLGIRLKDQSNPQKLEKVVNRLSSLLSCDDNYKVRVYYLFVLGFLFQATQQNERCLDSYYRGLELSISSSDKELTALAYNVIGIFYTKCDEYEKGIFHFRRALDSLPGSHHIMNNIAAAYIDTENYPQALKYLKNSIGIIKKMDLPDKANFSSINNMAIVYSHMNKTTKALECLNYCTDIVSKEINSCEKSTLLTTIASYYNHNGDFVKAENNILEAYKISQELNDQHLLTRNSKQLSEFYEENGNHEKALKYRKIFFEHYTFSVNNDYKQKIREIENKHLTEVKQIDREKLTLLRDNETSKLKLNEIGKMLSQETGLGQIGFFSGKMKQLLRIANIYHEDRSVSVLIEGETGTGKEVFARIIHNGYEDKSLTPFIVVNCSAISEGLFESEFFGYSEGAFTGAKKTGNIGKMELAEGGTLFLDEIGDLPLSLQPKLLRAIQYREISRVGSSDKKKLDIRIISATNQNLAEAVEKGLFRRDLYHRISTGTILIPPLRKRINEIEPLVTMFINEISIKKNKTPIETSENAIQFLTNYSWPGNIRELRNAIERVIITNDDFLIQAYHFNFLPNQVKQKMSTEDLSISIDLSSKTMKMIDSEIIIKVLRYLNGNISLAAKYLNVSRSTIYKYSQHNKTN